MTALTHADSAAAAWRAAVAAQRAATPDHGDFPDLAGHLVTPLRALEDLSRVLSGQIAGYGQVGVLRDDQGRRRCRGWPRPPSTTRTDRGRRGLPAGPASSIDRTGGPS